MKLMFTVLGRTISIGKSKPKLPDGVEIGLHFYLVSDSMNAEGKVSLRGNVPFPVPETINARALAEAAGLPSASDWRLMTRGEVAVAKADEISEAGHAYVQALAGSSAP